MRNRPIQYERLNHEWTAFATLIVGVALSALAPCINADHSTETSAHASATTTKEADPATSASMECKANLVRNGDFEQGRRRPDHWDPPRPGTVEWVDAGEGRGRVVRFRLNREIAETSGVKYLCAPIRPTPEGKGLQGRTYRLRADIKTDGPSVILFVKGYANVRGREREIYRRKKECRIDPGRWRTVELEFTPRGPAGRKALERRGVKTPTVEYLRVQLYTYGRPGAVSFDDVCVEAIGRLSRPEAADGNKQDSLTPNSKNPPH